MQYVMLYVSIDMASVGMSHMNAQSAVSDLQLDNGLFS